MLSAQDVVAWRAGGLGGLGSPEIMIASCSSAWWLPTARRQCAHGYGRRLDDDAEEHAWAEVASESSDRGAGVGVVGAAGVLRLGVGVVSSRVDGPKRRDAGFLSSAGCQAMCEHTVLRTAGLFVIMFELGNLHPSPSLPVSRPAMAACFFP